jgi:hypothetical protein
MASRSRLAASLLAVVSGVVLLTRRRPDADNGALGRGSPGIPANPKAKSLGYENTDISAKLVVRVLGGLVFTFATAIFILFLMIHGFRRQDHATNPPLTQQQNAAIAPPGPTLQRDPYRELRALQANEEGALSHYAWADPQHNRARIPLDRAMALVVGRSLEPLP